MEIKPFWAAALIALFLQSCGLADLRNESLKERGVTSEMEEKGRALLQEAWLAQGFDKLAQHEVYEVVATDHWKGLMGRMGNPWPVNDVPIRLRYAIGTFDGQFEVLEGKKEGFTAGLQSWQYYEKKPGGSLTFQKKADGSITFILAALQYFFELPGRLRHVPVVSYMGQRELKGQTYELVFASWEKVEPHQEHDQYVLYIHPESKLIEYASYTIRDNYLPGPKTFYGTIHYSGWRTIEGVKIPFLQSVFLNDPSEKESKYLHQLSVKEFRFDSFDKGLLYPDEELEPVGDEKIISP